MSPLFPTLLTLSFLLPNLAFAASDQKCYGLNGTPLDSSYAPCKPTSKHSGCCATNKTSGSPDICLDNGLCMATEGIYLGTIWQNGCTDATGSSNLCPKACPDTRTNFASLHPVSAWNIQTCSYGTYCCRELNDQRSCCGNATAPAITTSSLAAFISLPTPSTPSSSSLPSISPTPSPSSTSTPLSVSPSPSPQSQQHCKPDHSAAVGGALGGILGSIILGLVGLILWMYKKEKRQRKLKEHYEEQFGQNFAYRRTIVVESDVVGDGDADAGTREELESRGSGKSGGLLEVRQIGK